MNELVLTIGLPRSGKSTWANKQNIPIVNPNSIRIALHGEQFIGQAEPMVWVIAKYMVKSLFLAGHKKVILDATNITKKRRDEWKDNFWECKYILIDTDVETCIKRAELEGDKVIIDIIKAMNSKMEYPKSEEAILEYEGDE